MAMTVSSAFNASAEIERANEYSSGIRVFTASQQAAASPQSTLTASQPWAAASSASIGGANWTTFSAACWFYGRSLYDGLNGSVPIGLVALTYGPSPLQAWMPAGADAACGQAPPMSSPLAPSSVYNALLAPFTTGPLGLSGMVWWGGESNAPPVGGDGDWQWTQCAFPAFIQGVRAALNTSSLFFSFVQLPPVLGPFWFDSWPRARDAQLSALALPAVAVAGSMDLGDPTSPFTTFYGRNKQDAGARLAANALALVYGKPAAYQGPTVLSATATSSNSSTTVTVTVQYTPESVASGLVVNTAAACPGNVPHDDPNNAWLADVCVGWRVLTGYPRFPPPPTYTAQVPGGFIGAGNDLPGSGTMTVAQAEAACTADLSCVGFTFAADSPTPPGPVNIYLKGAFSFTQAAGWQTYNSTRKPVGQWYNAQSAAVGSDGQSIVVTAVLPNMGDTAVRLQYGYGTWPLASVSNGAGLPALPFEVNVTSATIDGESAAPVAQPRRLQPWLSLQPLKWLPLPLGTVRPAGWLAAQLNVELTGMAGWLHKFYPPVAYSPWIVDCSTVPGGCQDTNEGEDFAYWFQGAVPLALLTNDTRLLADIASYVDHILATQEASGWLGPSADPTDGNAHWARWPVLAGLLQWWEATGDARVLPALYAYMQEAYRRLSATAIGGNWAGSRWQDFVWLLQRLLDADPADKAGQKQFLTNFQWLVWGQGSAVVDWEAWYTPQYFAQGDTGWNYTSHGVNTAQGLKSGAVVYRMSGSASAVQSSATRLQLLDLYHGSPTGTFLADETLSSSMPSHGTELCAVVESMFSLNVMHEALGDASYADRAERVAYNALPGTWTSDMWAHQYLQQANAVNAIHQDQHVWLADGPDATTFGLAPNYPCCTANGPQGWPRFIPRMVHGSPDGGIAISLLGPLTASVPLPYGGPVVTLQLDTEYPFGDDVTITVTGAPDGMPLYLRVPDWATGATLAVDGAAPMALGAFNGTMYRLILGPGSSHTLAYALNPTIRTDSIGVLYNGAVSLHRGPLVYGMHLDESYNVTATHDTPSPDHPVLQDFSINSTSPWNVALLYDPQDPAGPAKFFTFQRTGAVNSTQPWDHAMPPMQIQAQARQIPAWGLNLGSAAEPPASPACTSPGACGAAFPITLYPYGATHLRMAVLPWTPQ